MKTILALAVLITSSMLYAEKPAAPKPYPPSLKSCVVSGDKLGEMGKPYTFVKDGQEVRLCCKDCVKDFNKDPKKYLKMIEDASKK